MGENLRIKSKQDLDQLLSGKTIKKAARRAKYLLIKLSNGNTLVMHLKLTGQFIFCDRKARPDDFTRLILNLDDARQIRFCDRNDAAAVFILEDGKKFESPFGPESFSITVEEVNQVINRHG